MDWNYLESEEGLAALNKKSADKPQVIFKHSTRCITSSMAKNRMDNSKQLLDKADVYLLNVIEHRPVSNLVAEQFGITHESPQVLVIKNGRAVYNESHIGIQPAMIALEL